MSFPARAARATPNKIKSKLYLEKVSSSIIAIINSY
jgi:hypothetical protein